MLRRLAFPLALVAACHTVPRSSAPAGSIGAKPGVPIEPGGGPVVAVKVEVSPSAPATVGDRPRGVAHFAQIGGQVVDRAGTRALSRDFLGAVRIWPTLDGTREPQVVPIQSPAAMAIEARADGSLGALIDTSGALTLLRFDGNGLIRSTGTLAPDISMTGVAILPGGERVLAVRGDQRVLLLDADGDERSRLAVRGARVVFLQAAGDGAIAILRRIVDQKPVFEVRRLAVTSDGLSWSGSARALPLPVAQSPHVAAAAASDGELLAYVGSSPSGGAEVRIVQVASGAEIALDDTVPVAVPASTTVGFTADRRVEVGGVGGGAWRIDVDGGKGTAVGAATTSGHTAPAYANGLRVSSYIHQLFLHEDDGAAFFLGHRDVGPSHGALSPDGEVAAWITAAGAIVVQRFDGSDDLRIKNAGEWWGGIAVIDDRHLLAGRNNGELVLFDSRTGAQIASKIVAQSTPWFWYEPKTKLVAVLRESGVVWAIRVDPAAEQPFGAPIAINDGAYNFMVLDPDLSGGGALMTIDSASQVREYTVAELTDGVSAREIKQKSPLAHAAWVFDRAGRTYLSTGSSVEVRDGDKLIRSLKIDGATGSIFPAPDGSRLAVGVSEPSTGVMLFKVITDDGKLLWTARSARNGISNLLWSADGSRVLVIASGTAIVVDAASGEVIADASAWAFARTHEVPQSFPPGVEPDITVVRP